MYFNFAALVALLPALGAATSYLRPSSDGDSGNDAINLKARNVGSGGPGRNTCDGASFNPVLQPDENKPLVADCQDMLNDIQQDREWIVSQNSTRTLVTKGTCAFNAMVEGSVGNLKGVVGNQDVIDITNDSITKFGSDGHVAAYGSFGVLVNAAGVCRATCLAMTQRR
ncbi:ECP2 protein [Teratosphaeria destructans]|uniref:ECP2 protein n=1 Tax=Teratosphaeria destructans TaxID=418781 RepID=A0A9W7SUB4_9PEZI|nr:ECP2 protein [Teratosphaeria destructans]